MDINNLLRITILNQVTGQKYKLIGFITAGDDRAGLYVKSVKLYDVDRRTFRVVDQGSLEMKSLAIVQE